MAARGCDLACLVPPARMDHVEAIASNLETMPPKSTYFYPKLLSGLVLNPLAVEPDRRIIVHLAACRGHRGTDRRWRRGGGGGTAVEPDPHRQAPGRPETVPRMGDPERNGDD